MEIIKRNWRTKLFSLIIAIFLWSFIIASENPTVSTRITSVPIIYENTDVLDSKGLILDDNIKKSVDLTVSGKRNDIINITSQHIRVGADFKEVDEGTHKLQLKYNLPDGIDLEEYESNIDVSIEKIISKDFDIKVENTDQLQDNYILESTIVTPDKITVKGPRSKVDKIIDVVAQLDLSKLTSDSTVNTEVIAIDKDNNEVDNITYGQEFVNVNTIILKQKEVDIKLNIVGDVENDYRIENYAMNKSKVYIKGPEKIIDTIDKVDTQEINVSNFKSNRKENINLVLPNDVELVSPDNELYVDFQVERKSRISFEIPKSQIELINTNPDFNYVLEEDPINISFTGFNNKLSKIDTSKIKLSVDVNRIDEGYKSIEPKVLLDGKEIEKNNLENIGKVRFRVTKK